jgi:hypothetical protein
MIKNLFCYTFLILSTIFSHLSAQDDAKSSLDDVQEMKLRVNAKIFYTPLFGIKISNLDTVFKEKQLTSDLKNGHGYGAYIGMDIVDKFETETFNIGFGLLAQETRHDSDLNLYHLTADSYLFEINLYNTFYRSKKIDIIQQFGISGGAVFFDYDKARKDFVSGMGAARYMINLEFYKHWDLDVGGGLFVWGQPGMTQGYGGFFMIQFGCRF